MRRPAAIGWGLGAGVVLALALPAGPAGAHADLLRTEPAAGTVVGSLPAAVTLTFSERVQPVADRIQVIAPDGGRANGTRVGEGWTDTVRVPLRAGGPDGTYALSYRVVSDDGHPVTGVVTFSVGVTSTVPPIPASAGAPAVALPLLLAMGTAHFVAVAGLALLAGPALFLLRLWPAGVSRRGARRLLGIGLASVAAGSAAELGLQASYTGGSLGQALVSPYGVVHLARLIVLAALVIPLGRLIDGRGGRASVSILALLGLVTWPLTGHPRTSALPVLTVVADAAHLGALALWAGGLVTLLAFVLRHGTAAELSRVLPAWSRWAEWTVVVLVAAGSAEAVAQVRGFGRLLDTTYGKLLLIKILMLTLILVVAAFSRRLVQRKPADGRLRRAVLIETAGIVLVLGVAMTLVQSDPPSAQAARTEPRTGPGLVTGLAHMGMLIGPTSMVEVRVSPSVAGINHIQVYAYSRAGAPLTVLRWTATAELPGRSPLGVPLTGMSGNHAAASLPLPWPGRWQLRITMTLPRSGPVTVIGLVTVRPG